MKAILRIFPFVLFLCCMLASCDDGNVEETYRLTREGKVASLKMNNVTGMENWADGYTLAFAAFSESSDYAIMLKYIRTVSNGKLDMVLSNIPDSVTSVELCVVNRLRQRVVTFASVEGSEVTAASENDTIHLRQDNLSLSMFAALQENVFNTTCINCHGGSNFVAANLNLTEGKSHAALVGQPSSKVEGLSLVTAGDAANSVLYQTLVTPLSQEQGWHYDHTQEVVRTKTQKLIEDWINAGAAK